MRSRLVLGPFFFLILLFSSSIYSAFSSDISSATIGDQVTFTWSSSASSCTASGSWSGSKPGSGTEEVTLPAEGWNMFTLNCGASWEYVWVWGEAEVFQQTNNPPVISGFSSSISVAENQTSVLSVTATDAEGDPLSYSLSGTDSASLSISSSGVLTFNTAPDYETKNSYSITVNVSDGIVTTSKALTINITDVNEDSGSTSSSYDISAGLKHACAIDDNGVACWGGDNIYGQTNVPNLSNPSQVSAGGYHSCALDDNGVNCWGDDQRGGGLTTVPSLSNPKNVTLGDQFSCSLDDSGVICWGYNGNGQISVPVLSNPTQVDAGRWHVCAVDDTGVVCWGHDGNGKISPPNLSNPTQVSAGSWHSCAIDDTGVVCWGHNANGQGNVPSLSNPTQVSTGKYQTCALDDSGVKCWGSNGSGEIDVPLLSNPIKVSASEDYTCALDDNGVTCWGSNSEDQTNVPNLSFTNSSIGGSSSASSNSSNSSAQTNEPQVTLSSIYKVATGVNNTCVIDDRGLSCWGDNTGGKSDVPSTLSNPIEVSPGGAMHTCAIDDNGVVCWGLNVDGRTSPPTIINPKIITSGWDYSCALDDYGVTCWGRNNSSQTTVPNLSNPTHVDAGHGHACAIDSSGLVCWGDNEYGQIDVPSLSNPTGVSAGKLHTCAIENSDVVCWGNDSSTLYSNKPVLTNVVSVVAAEQHTCALDDNGVHCWGADGFGAATVPPLTNPIQVDTRDVHTCALDKNGLTCWGWNASGRTDVPDNLSFTRTVTISGSTTTSTEDSSSSNSDNSSSSNSDNSSSGSTDSSSSSSYDSSFFNTSDENSGDQQEGSGNNSCNNLELGVQDSSFSFGGFVNIGSFGGFGDNLNTSCNSIDGVLYASSPSAAEVFIDQNLSGIKDFNEPSDFSSSSGNFSISGINDQEYECLKNKPLIATLSSGEDFYSIDPYNLNSTKTITAFSSLRNGWVRSKEFIIAGCEDFPAMAAIRRGRLKDLDLRLQQGFDVSLNDLLKDPRETDLSSPISEERASAIEEFIRSTELIENNIFNEFSSEFSTAGVQHSSASFLPISNYSIFLSNTYPNPATKTNPIVTSIDQVSVRMNAWFTASLENAVGPWDSYALITTRPLISNAGELIENRDSCFVSFTSLCKIDPSFLGLFQYPRTKISWTYHQSTVKGEEIVKEMAQIKEDGSCVQVNVVSISDYNVVPSSSTKRDYEYSNISNNGYFDLEILECERQNSSPGHRELALYEYYPSGASAYILIQVPYDSINDSTINLLSGLDNFNWESIDSGSVVPPSIPSNFSALFQELSFDRQMYDSLPWDGSSGISGYSFSEASTVYFTATDKNGRHSALVNFPGFVACFPANKQIVFSSTADSSGANQVVDNCFEYLDKDFIWPDTVDDTIFNNPDAFSTLDPYDQ